MRLTANGRYAVTAMLELAQVPNERMTSLQMIAERQSISLAYLEQIFTKLKKGGIVVSRKGPGGGYQLAKTKDSISIADILEAVGSSIHTMQCDGQKNCQQGNKCSSHDLWETLKQEIEQFLRGMTLAKLVENTHSEKLKLTEL